MNFKVNNVHQSVKTLFIIILMISLHTPINKTKANSVDTKNYGDLTLSAPWTTTHWNDVWDLTQGDLTLSYIIDMRGLNQPGTWDTYNWETSYTEVGLRGEGAGDFNPGPFDTYQGRCGGWMVSDSDTWLDSDGFTERGNPNPDEIQDLDDKHALQSSGGRGERDYDVLLSDPNIVLDPPIGSFSNYGIWYDRDGVDPWQDNDPTTGGVSVPWGQQDGRKTYNTGGVYLITITYHAISDDLGVMFATINGDAYGEVEPEEIDVPVPQGFVRNQDGTYQHYPAGLSFKGDMKHMQVFAGIWAPNTPSEHDYGDIIITQLQVEGILGTSDPLNPDFTYNVAFIGTPIQFTDITKGGMPPYSYEWDFDEDGITDSTENNPEWTFVTEGYHDVTLIVTPHRCVPKEITKTIYIWSPRVGGELLQGSHYGDSLFTILGITLTIAAIVLFSKKGNPI